VVVAATEDAWAETIVPRLMAAGADLDLVLRVDVETGAGKEGLTLPTDVPALAQMCADYQVALILLDPLMGTISGALDSHKDAEVRRALEPITRLADIGRIAVVGLIHQNKGGKGDLLQKLMASVAFSAVARGVLVCAKYDEAIDEHGEPVKDHFVIGQPKSNLGPKVDYSIEYRIESMNVGYDPDVQDHIISSRIQELGQLDERVEDILHRAEHPARSAPVTNEAEEWLRSYLDLKGDIPSSVVKEAALSAGLRASTVDKAAARLGVAKPDPSDGRRTLWGISSMP
jgi:hypothetical protein